MNIYLASKYQDRDTMVAWRDQLRRLGHTVTSRWIDGGHDLADDAHDDAERVRFAREDLADLWDAELMILHNARAFHGSGRGGRHVETGVAIALAIPVILVGARENVFHWLPEVYAVPDFLAALVLLTETPFHHVSPFGKTG